MSGAGLFRLTPYLFLFAAKELFEEVEYLLEEVLDRLEELDETVGYYFIVVNNIAGVVIKQVAE